jgi:DNA gyrase inhibitor GyrI
MNTPILKLFSMTMILSAVTLQASSPLLPDLTAVQVEDIPAGYYAVQIRAHGYEWQTYNEYTDWVPHSSPVSGTEVFPTDHKFCHRQDYGVYLDVGVYVKQYSNSPWTFYGSIRSDSGYVTRSITDYYLYYLSFSWNDLPTP